jgi:hypothetical protein
MGHKSVNPGFFSWKLAVWTDNCLQQVKGPWHRLSRVHRDILIFTSSALKTWVLHVNTFYSWILLYISPVTAVNISILSVLYITHIIIGGAVYYSVTMNKVSTYTDPSKCINDHTLRSDTEFCRTCRECHSLNCPTKSPDKILPGRSESESIPCRSVYTFRTVYHSFTSALLRYACFFMHKFIG